MSDEVKNLLLQVDASVELMRRNLSSGMRTLDDFERKAEKSTSAISGHFDNIGKAAAATRTALLALGGAWAFQALSGGVGAIAEANREFDTLRARMETAAGSAQAADRAFAWLEEFAKETPYGLTEAVDAFIRLKNLGLDPSAESLRSYGNTAAAMGESLDKMIEAVADAATGEFERLKQFGIRASKEGEKITFTFQGVATEVGFSAREIETYLKSIGDNKFGDQAARQAKTADGEIAALDDSLNALLRTLGELGANEAFSWLRQQATETFKSIDAQIRGTAEVYRQSGLFGVLGSSNGTLEMSGTKSGRHSLLEQDVNRANLDLLRARQATAAGGFRGAVFGGKNVEDRARNALRAAEARLAEYYAANVDEILQGGAGSALFKDFDPYAGAPAAAAAGGTSKEAEKLRKEQDREAERRRKQLLDAERKFQTELRALREELTPGLGARREYDEDLLLLERARKAGQLTADEFERLRQSLRGRWLDDTGLEDLGVKLSESLKLDGFDDKLQRELDALPARNQALLDAIDKPFREAAELGKDISANIAQAVVHGQALGPALVNSFKAAAAEAMANGLFKLLFGEGTATSSGLFGSLVSGIGALFGGARADGGPVAAGRAYLVGERGPEIIVPPSAGRVIPNHALGGGGTTIHVDARGATDPGAVEQAALAAFMAARSYTDGAFAGAARPRLRRSWGA